MAQTGYTPIQLYYSSTTTNAPTAGNLASGELAINITDGKLFYKDNGGVVQVIAWKTTPTTAGGTGLTSWTAGDLPYYATGTTLSKLGIGTNGQILTSTGTAPQWSTLSGVAVTTFSAGTTGFTPSSATSGAVTLAGTLATTNGGTGLTSFTANGVVYASSSSALTTGSALTFDGTTLASTQTNAFAPNATFTQTASAGGVAFIKVQSNTAAIDLMSGGSTFGVNYMDADEAGLITQGADGMRFNIGGSYARWTFVNSEQMRLTSTGLGIGTSSPAYKLDVSGASVNNPTGGAGSRAVLRIADTTAVAANNGGGILFRGVYTGTTQVDASGIQAYKANATDGDYSYGLAFATRTNGSDIAVNMRLDPSGNLGLGVTPSAWVSNGKALQVGSSAGILSSTALEATVTNNCYLNFGASAWVYLNTAQASRYQQYQGVHSWFTAGSGTAGNIVTFTQAMTLSAAGGLSIGTTTDAGAGNIRVNGGALIGDGTAAAPTFTFYNESNVGIFRAGAGVLGFSTAGTERARITSGGTFQLTNNYQEGVLTANTGTAYTIDLVNGTLQILTLTGNCTFTFPTATAGQSFTMLLRQDGTGGRTVTWPAAVRWPGNTAPTITSTASQTDKYIFTSDGTRWYGSNAGQAYVA